MQRASTTVVALVGADTDAALARVDRPANVRAVMIDPALPALDRAVEATTAAGAAHIPFLVHDADPLAATADAWVRRFDGGGPVGELEVVCSETLARWRTGAIELPDYYWFSIQRRCRPRGAIGLLGSSTPRRAAEWCRRRQRRSRRCWAPCRGDGGGLRWTGS